MILGTKEKARASWAHTDYRGIVARSHSVDESACDSGALRKKGELQFDDILPDGPGRLVCSRRSGWANRPPTITITLFPLALMPKAATGFGEIRMGNGLSWRCPQEKAELTPKPARRSTALGKSKENPFIMAIAKPIAIRLVRPFGLARFFGLGKQEGMALVVRTIDDNRPQFRVSPF